MSTSRNKIYPTTISSKLTLKIPNTILNTAKVNPIYTVKVGDNEIPLTESQYMRLKDAAQVPEGYILAVGDNYEVSVDSRDYGFVSVKNVLGKVLCK